MRMTPNWPKIVQINYIHRRVVERIDFDSPWKEILETYFEEFMIFFFPQVHAEIDWGKGYEFLDKELQQITREADVGKRLVDKLVKVWTRTGEQIWVLIHIEVQNQYESGFEQRMFIYYTRICDLYDRPVASFAILGDDNPSWRPNQLHSEFWGTRIRFEFSTIKLLDYIDQWAELEADDNPFATVVMAHLKTLETKHDAIRRQQWKLRLVKRLYQRGYDRQSVINLLRFIDWLVNLPEALEEDFWQSLRAYQEEQQMQYVMGIERIAEERGRKQGLEQGIEQGIERGIERERDLVLRLLDRKLGDLTDRTRSQIRGLSLDQLEDLGISLLDFSNLADLEDWLNRAAESEG